MLLAAVGGLHGEQLVVGVVIGGGVAGYLAAGGVVRWAWHGALTGALGWGLVVALIALTGYGIEVFLGELAYIVLLIIEGVLLAALVTFPVVGSIGGMVGGAIARLQTVVVQKGVS